MISKQHVLNHNTQEAAMLRYIDSELLKYSGQVIEFKVEQFPQELLDKYQLVYESVGWTIKQTNHKHKLGWRSFGPTERYWRVK